MYYITDYAEQAIDKVIPYLLEYPQIVKILEQNASRYQTIEDVLWDIATNFKIDDARGIFLDAWAHNENASIVFSDKADDAFTYGTDKPLKQAYGTGHYYSLSSYLGGSRKNISTEKMIRSIKSKIIENNTNCTIEDFIEAIQLFYNPTNIKIFESYPLNISLMLKCDESEMLTQGNYDFIKTFLPACVSLKNLYHNTGTYNLNQNGASNLGISRYPRDIKDGLLTFPYYYQSFELNSDYDEYIKTNYTSFKDGMFCCITGCVTKIYENNTFFSSSDGTNNISIQINNDNQFTLNGNTTSINAVEGSEYTFILYNNGSKLSLWVDTKISVDGRDLTKDTSYILSKVSYTEPNVYIDNFTSFDADVYIKGDFNYYSIIFGEIQDSSITANEYYVTSCGQKEVLFNCISNNNHLLINSSISTEHVDAVNYQSSFIYSKTHGNGMYAYFDGISDISYNILPQDFTEQVTNMDINLDICPLFENEDSNILQNFVGDNTNTSNIILTSDRNLSINIPVYDSSTLEYSTLNITSVSQLNMNEFSNINVIYQDNKISLYINNVLDTEKEIDTNYTILGIPKTLNIGSKFLGFIKNVNITVNENNLQSVFTNTLRTDNNSSVENIVYTNNGVKLITTPQLYDDTTDTDLYGNELIGVR